ncbi:MAG: LON peptidase substrate-binding domain-containing protein [Candidatus Melainabacteria bacterium]|nr:LON peptidase substrate-binding domain-containing protein [Candidatus Melainabacteria bacterium]
MIKSSRTRLPVFPLPGVVLLPNSMLPLHIFEYRYREMLADILASTREFIVVNSECDASQSQVGCIAKVIQAQRRPDGRSDIITVGSDRVRINSYFHGKSYLSANFSTLHDAPVHFTQVVSVTALKAAMNQLISLVRRVYKKDLQCTFSEDEDAESLSFIAAGMLDFDADELQQLLATEKTFERIDLILPKIHLHNKELAAMAAIEAAFGAG